MPMFYFRLFYKTTTMELPYPRIIMTLHTLSSVSKKHLIPTLPVLPLYHIHSEGAWKPWIPGPLPLALRQDGQINQMVLIPHWPNDKGQPVVTVMELVLVPTSPLPIRLDPDDRAYKAVRRPRTITICLLLHWCPRAPLVSRMRVIWTHTFMHLFRVKRLP